MPFQNRCDTPTPKPPLIIGQLVVLEIIGTKSVLRLYHLRHEKGAVLLNVPMPDWPDRTGYYTWYAPAYVRYIGLYIFNITIIITALAISLEPSLQKSTSLNRRRQTINSETLGQKISWAIFGDEITSVMAVSGGRQKIIGFGWFIIALIMMGEDCGWAISLEVCT